MTMKTKMSNSRSRRGWEAAAARLTARREGGLLDEPLPNAFDDSEWVWSEVVPPSDSSSG